MTPRRLIPTLPAATALLAMLLAGPVLALESDAQQPIHISADQLTIDDQAGTAVYTGTVHVEQGSLKLDAQRVELQRGASGGLSTMRATGTSGQRAYIEQQPSPQESLVRGWGDTLIYHAGERRVEMLGNAELHRGGDTFTGAYVEYFLDSRQVNARGGQQSQGGEAGGRVNMTLTPEGGSN
ncbi:lipopolysaccharide transport periplasmic protein LptA [Halotalea alkalilenta]|uniref:Lipopolysaccharide export system protein LptA n=1 Tax=Halotalea alkalilenta TaxID=376489 RepID=A0A172YE15_9GAMM|nr:lipopolysaccharide transport periplasmic protein LptA [Halotalea alkalilenta]ANF57511.1 lipopolysaccharide transport periplasmic protein LptA [Halotalea alkalilenta]